jgi:hypothetical protein
VIKTGPQIVYIEAHTKYVFAPDGGLSLWAIKPESADKDVAALEPADLTRLVVVVPPGEKKGFISTDPFFAYARCEPLVHWMCESTEVPPPVEYPDPTPVEIPADVELDLTLEQKLQRFIRREVLEAYGRDSTEFDSIEEAMDFGPDEEPGVRLSGFEVPDEPMTPIEPAPAPQPTASSEPEPAPEPAPTAAPPEPPPTA